MFLLLIGCALQVLTLVNCQGENITASPLPYPTLKAIVKHIKDLLHIMDEKINNERNRIAALEASGAGCSSLRTNRTGPCLDTSGKSEILLIHRDPTINVRTANTSPMPRQKVSSIHLIPLDVEPYEVPGWPYNIENINNGKMPKNKLRTDHVSTTSAVPKGTIPLIDLEDVPSDVVSDELPKLPDAWPFNEQFSSAAALRTRDPASEELEMEMANQDHGHIGYCQAAITIITDTFVEKLDLIELKLVIDAFVKIIERMIFDGKLTYLDDVLISRVKIICIWTSLSSLDSLKDITKNLRVALNNTGTLPADVLKIFTEYDAFFTADEGKLLLKKVEEFHSFNRGYREDMTEAVESMIQSIIDALVAPANRMSNSFELRSLLNTINQAYQKRYPDFRRSDIDAVMKTMTEHQRHVRFETDPRRRMGSEISEFEISNLLQQLIIKHPKILSQFNDFFETAVINPKNHHYTQKKTSKRKVSTIMSQKMYTRTTQRKPKIHQSLRINKQTMVAFHTKRIQKHFSVISVLPKLRRRTRPSVLTNRLLRRNITRKYKNYNTRPNTKRLNLTQKYNTIKFNTKTKKN